MRAVLTLALVILTKCQDQKDAPQALNLKLGNLRLSLLELRELVKLFQENEKKEETNIDEVIQSCRQELADMNKELGDIYAQQAYAGWNYRTNITNENADKLSQVGVDTARLTRKLINQARKLLKEDKHQQCLSPDMKRQLALFAQDATLKNDMDVRRQEDLHQELQKIYSTAKVERDGIFYSLEPQLTEVMAKSREPDELLWAWKSWRDVTGPAMKRKYEEYVRYLNEGAMDNGYQNYAEYWIESQFDNTPDLEKMAEELWEELKPLYQQLHAYVRRRLHNAYPDVVGETGAIPAHLLGNMWAQNWENIYDLVVPYPYAKEHDIDKEMLSQKYTVESMFKMAEHFFMSIGLYPMTQTFWQKSMIVKPEGREVQCHASAEDFYTEDDFRIKMCTGVSSEYLETVHHEMGHIEYFMAYEDQPTIYRTGANSAFHEAIGDTISLSVMTTKHLKTVNLIPEKAHVSEARNKEENINYLMKKALIKLAFIPFGYMIDKWRFEVFRGRIKPSDYNRAWWELRLKYQGIVAPVQRSEDDFDPGSKFHVPSNSPYICYFVSFIIQFQFYDAMCQASGHTGDLHTCDFYQSHAAGTLLRDVMAFGKKKPWPDAMEAITGQRSIKTSAINEYFAPLLEWLQEQNRNEIIGWDDATINFETK
ncbi:hypothetical protein ACJMK2_022959 [Sinanodonta woodiana]|uniref:Angiotensin-converting enzyme n=1 Tax=Sinanodonta woodiana TaxID=1069815 RepID=A0ABD3TMS5_SINWO